MEKKNCSNFMNEDINPCIEETKLTQKCLEIALYDYSKCEKYFENYRQCKKFWGNLCGKRKRQGIQPLMPTKKERIKILELKKEGINVMSAEFE